MNENALTSPLEVPKRDDWPGVIAAYRLVKPYVKSQIWNFVSVLGLGIILALIANIILSGTDIKNSFGANLLNDLVELLIGAFIQTVVVAMYFGVLKNKPLAFGAALSYGLKRYLKMIGLLIVIYVVMVASFILLIVPFFIVLPRLYLAPYYLIGKDCSVNQAIAASWHSTKNNAKKVYAVILLDVAIVLLFLTIIGIPLAIYFGVINSASFALLVLYLSQPAKLSTKQAA